MAKRTARGRRPGSPGTKEKIRAAAASAFTHRGYDGVTLRSIAEMAGVDPALIHHYYKTKRGLYEATLALPDFGEPHLNAALRDAMPGEALVHAFLSAWDGPPEGSAFARLLRSAATDESAQARLAELIASTVIAPAAAAVQAPASLPKLRAALVAAHLSGLAWTRYVLRLEPIASASVQLIAKTLGPSVSETLGAVRKK